MNQQKAAKKLPKRTSRPAHKTRRQESWARGRKRKAARNEAQERAHERNVKAGTSPWAESKAARKTKRN